jgi:hypothetical protein
MDNCGRCQNLLLDYLYDLLEGDELWAVEEHLKHCPTCATALEQARQQKLLLALAARMQCAPGSFQAPAEPPPRQREPAPAVVRIPAPRRPWLRWAVAAAVVLALAGLSAPAGWYWHDYAVTRQAADDYQAALTATSRQINQTDADANRAAQHHTDQIEKVRDDARKRDLRLTVTGRPTVQSGAPNTYQILARDLNGVPVAAHLSVRVRSEGDGKPVYEERDVAVIGQYRVTLPADLPVKPNARLALEVVARREGQKGEVKGEVREQLSLVPPVYVTHLATDKPMYSPGETVHFRSLTLDRNSLKPPDQDLQLLYTVRKLPDGPETAVTVGTTQLTSDKDKKLINGPDGKPVRGLGAGDWTIPEGSPGGEYALTVTELTGRFPPQQRKFLVNRYERPKLNKVLEWGQKTYGPGEEVLADCKVTKAEGGTPVANKPVFATIQIDGQVYDKDGNPTGNGIQAKTDDKGQVEIRFKLPKEIARGEGSLAVNFTDGGNNETLSKPIPIIARHLQVEFYPEGGELVPGLPNRVYFQARTPLGKAADLKGHLVDNEGKEVLGHVFTLTDPKNPGANQGTGVFEFTPAAGKKYELRIDAPVGIEDKFGLPDLKEDGVVLSVPTGVTRSGEPIRVVVGAAHDPSGARRNLFVGAYCRGRVLDQKAVTVKNGEPATVELRPTQEMGGVCRVTVFEERGAGDKRRDLVPVAERLVYRMPAEELNLEIKADKAGPIPGEKVSVTFKASNEKEELVPAVVTVAVVDKSVITLADEKTARGMPTHFLLTTEVRKPEDLEHADFLLAGTQGWQRFIEQNPERFRKKKSEESEQEAKAALRTAKEALDLLLGTQGWRRFAEQNPEQFRQKNPGEADRLLVMIGQSSPQTTDLLEKDLEAVDEEYAQQVVRLRDERLQAVARLQKLQDRREAGTAAALAAQASLERYQAAFEWFRRNGLPLLGMVLLLGAAVVLVIFLLRTAPRHIPVFAGALACALLLLTVLGIHFTSTELEQEKVGKQAEMQAAQQKQWAPAAAPMPAQGMMGGGAMAPGDLGVVNGAMDGAPQAERKVEGLALPPRPLDDKADAAAPAPLAAPPPPGPAGAAPRAAMPMRMGAAKGGDKPGGMMPVGPGMPGPGLGMQPGGMGGGFGGPGRGFMPPGGGMADPHAGGGKDKRAADEADQFNGLLKGGEAGKQMQQMQREQRRENEEMDRLWEHARQADGQEALNKDAVLRELRDRRKMPQPGGPGGFPGGGPAFGMGEQPPPAPPPPSLVVREFAHLRPEGRAGDVRRDFAETLFWQPVLVLGGGKGQATFDLNDSVTTFQVAVFGHTLDGRIGSATANIESRLPFALEPKLPSAGELNANDKIDIPVTVANNTDGPRDVTLSMSSAGLKLLQGKARDELKVAGQERTRRVYRFQPELTEGTASVTLEGETKPFAADRIRRQFRVVPEGFPIENSKSDLLEGAARVDVTLPETWVAGTLKVHAHVYPSTLANLVKGLEGLLREPGGCFEQTSTSNYPNVLILNYLKETEQSRPELETRARGMLDRGYSILTSFECPYTGDKPRKNGYEWFGAQNNAHEALTAYGLMEFRDMARVYNVNPDMLDRTRKFLMAQKDGKGGFTRNPQALDTFGRAPADVTNAYIVWAITEGGKDDDVTKELDALAGQAKTAKDPYFLALVANSLLNRDRRKEAVDILKVVKGEQKEDGHVEGAKTSITASGGRDLEIETTALAVLGWLKATQPEEFTTPIEKAVKWIGQQRGGYGGFGSTQSTILALKALIAHARANKKTAEAGEVKLFVGDSKEPAVTKGFAASAQDAIDLELPNPEKHLKAGKNALRVEISGKNNFPFTLAWSYNTLQPASAEKVAVKLSTKLDREQVTEGDAVRLTVHLENVSGQGQGMAVAVVGLPAGLTVPEDFKQLQALAALRNDGKERGPIDAFELRGRELVLYWRDLAPGKKIDVPVDLICQVPGEYRGPASRAYLYYNADHKDWVKPLQVTIKAKE